MYAVNLYLVDRAYGGAEEGGWWFDCGQPELHPLNRVFASRDDARQYLEDVCKPEEIELNEGRREISSVLSEGQYRFYIGDKGEMPAVWPAERPHYE
jgi:hypothetical protein